MSNAFQRHGICTLLACVMVASVATLSLTKHYASGIDLTPSIHGIRYGMTKRECMSRLGESHSLRQVTGEVHACPDLGVTVEFRDGLVHRAFGPELWMEFSGIRVARVRDISQLESIVSEDAFRRNASLETHEWWYPGKGMGIEWSDVNPYVRFMVQQPVAPSQCNAPDP